MVVSCTTTSSGRGSVGEGTAVAVGNGVEAADDANVGEGESQGTVGGVGVSMAL
ncbi:MAG: hypothetical protein GTN93_08225 [Anaerolineae bacterium]|nr:hypothetical protein [Anaerolineae bacterium]